MRSISRRCSTSSRIFCCNRDSRGGQNFNPYFDDFDSEPDRSVEALRQAILDALIESGQFTPELLEALRGDGNKESQEKLSELLDSLDSEAGRRGLPESPGTAPGARRSPAG